MKLRKALILVLIVFIFSFSGCESSNSPRGFWNRYIKAMNSKNIEKVAEVYYKKGTTRYLNFIEETNEDMYFFGYDKIKTVSFIPLLINPNYYLAEITIDVDGDYEVEFFVYFARDVLNKWEFISEVKINSLNPAELGNKANNNYYASIIKEIDGFKYKYVYVGETPADRDVSNPGRDNSKHTNPNDYIRIVEPLKNNKIVEIPSEIDGKPVEVIGDYAFFHYKKVLSSFTIASSKMEQLILPNSIKKIENHAFSRSVKLKELELPSSLVSVGNYAFAGCTQLKALTINVNEAAMYNTREAITGKDSMLIEGDGIIYVGDQNTYTVNGASVNWSVDNEDIATVDETGNLVAVATGTVMLTATNKLDATKFSKASIIVKPAAETNTTIESLNVEFSYNPIFIEGAFRRINKGDFLQLYVEGAKVGEIIWESSDSSKLKVHEYNGTVLAVDRAETAAVTITAKRYNANNPNDSNIIATVKININNVSPLLTFGDNALDRLDNLEALYVNAINPYSIDFKTWNFNDKVKIYVPAQNYQSYLEVWSSYKSRIYILDEE